MFMSRLAFCGGEKAERIRFQKKGVELKQGIDAGER